MPITLDSELPLKENSEQVEWLKSNQPGMITFFGEGINQQQAASTIDLVKDNTQDLLPILFAVDHEGGTVQRFNGAGFMSLPSWSEACATLTAEKKTQIYQQSARELAKVGINFVFAPMLDVASKHLVLKTRVCADTTQLKESADIYILAFAEQGIMPVVKHFPGIGSSKLDLHDQADEIDLQKEELDVFKEILDKYPNIGAMSAHVKVKNEFGGAPCSLSQECLQRFEDVYSQVLLFTDALDMESVQPATTVAVQKDQVLAEVSKEALLAGNDVLVYGKGVTTKDLDKVINYLASEYNDSNKFKARVDEALEKILELKKIDQQHEE